MYSAIGINLRSLGEVEGRAGSAHVQVFTPPRFTQFSPGMVLFPHAGHSKEYVAGFISKSVIRVSFL